MEQVKLWIDAGMVLSYSSIAVVYYYILYHYPSIRQDRGFFRIYLVFVVFFVSSGLTHVANLVSLWIPGQTGQTIFEIWRMSVTFLTAGILVAYLPKLIAVRETEQETLREKEKQGRMQIDRMRQALDQLAQETRGEGFTKIRTVIDILRKDPS